jgi:ribonucleotide reductase alpha subunit
MKNFNFNYIKVLDYFKGDDLAASTWINKYALKNEEGEIIEGTPDDMHKRLAREFYKVEKTYQERDYMKTEALSNYGQNRPMLSEDAIYELFKNFKYIIPGGSVMSGLGSSNPISLSNCFVIDGPNDSYQDIMRARTEQIQLMKRRGGVGYDLSKLRPRGAKVHNAAVTSTGAASFMDVCSDITNEVAQEGRRGALMLTISINHPDVEEFITKKQDLTKVTGANISVQVTDEFMKAVEKEEDFILRYPVSSKLTSNLNKEEVCKAPYNELCVTLDSFGNEVGYYKKVKAKDLWNKLIHCAWNTAEPGVIFSDHMKYFSPDSEYPQYQMVCTNPCQPEWATVLTPNGISTFKEIHKGSIIWSSEGWTKVLRKSFSGIKEVREYRTTSGIFYGTSNHRIVSKGIKVKAEDAESIDVLQGFNSKHSTLDKQDIIDGLVFGDGSVHKASNNRIILYIGGNDSDYYTDPEIEDYILQKDMFNHKVTSISNEAHEVSTTITPQELPLTYQRSIPDRFLKGSADKVKGFLRGLYSANGSVISNRVTLKTASSVLRDQVQLMLSSIGIRSYYTTNKSKDVRFINGTYSCRESYDINISTDRNVFAREIGFIQKYKTNRLEVSLKHSLKKELKTSTIISDEIIDTEPVYNITVDNKSHTYWTGGLNVSNCGEIGMGAYDSCRLLHINLTSFVDRPFTETATVNYKKLYEITYEAQRLADDLVTLEIKAIDRIISHLDKLKDKDEIELWNKFRNTALGGRRTGVGFTGLMDMLAMVSTNTEIKTADPSMELVLRHISYSMMQAELDCTIDMAITRGVFLDYDNPAKYTLHLSNWNKFVSKEFPGTFDRMCKYGRRNISFSTIAPTGTVSIMARCSSGIEPIFRAVYKRKRKCMSPSEQADFVDKNGERFITFVVVHPGLRQWAETIYPKEVLDKLTAEKWEQLCKDSPYNCFTADSMSIGERLDIQSLLQKYITHSISSTINVSKEISEDSIGIIYFTAWERGCKGITIYRDGSREGVLTSIKEAKPDNILCCNAPKRPKELVADYYQIKVKGEQFIVLVGLYKDKPYEIFCLKTLRPVNVPFHQGIITKLSKMHYHFKSKYYEIANLEDVNANMEEKATTLYASMLLRHGVAIKYIIKTAKKVDDNIASFTAAICRVLSKYMEKEELNDKCPKCGATLIREEGCIHCSNCDYSKCG